MVGKALGDNRLLLGQRHPFGIPHARVICKKVIVRLQGHDLCVVWQHGIYPQFVPVELREGLLGVPCERGHKQQQYDELSYHVVMNVC